MKKGFTLVEIMIVVAIIGLLAAIAIPSFMRARTTAQANACINNLRQIESAKDQYALEAGLSNMSSMSTHWADIGPSSGTNTTGQGGFIKSWPVCPASTNYAFKSLATMDMSSHDYIINPVGSNVACNQLPPPANPAHSL